MGYPEEFGEQNARLTEARVVGLQTRQEQVKLLSANSRGECASRNEGIGGGETVILDKDAAVGALGQGLANR